MGDPRDDLADLAADLRAVLEANVALGVQHEPIVAAPPADVQAGPAPAARAARPAPAAPSSRASRDPGLIAPRPAPPPTERPTVPARAPQAAAPSGEVGAVGLDAIRAHLGDCTRCALSQGRRNLVFGVGDPDADLMVVGEAPGFKEDQRGEPFVGPAGEMLDRMLENVLQLRREQVYIANIVKCRPPRNRNPLPPEVETCMPFLHRQIRAVRPRVLLVLGTVAFKSLFRTDDGITRSRGTWREWEGIPAMPTFHPAYLLRQPQDKRLTFHDLQAARARYDTLGGRR